jgi:outer membrane protein assembly factor BamB
MASDEKGLPATFDPGKKAAGGQYDTSSARNLKWCASMGTITCAGPVVSGGKVFVGTNNACPRDPKYQGEYGILLCLEEGTGKLLWQLSVPAVPDDLGDMFYFGLGFCSTPAAEGKRLYAVTNRCEVVCLNTGGLAAGNEGPFRDEGTYFAPPASQHLGPAVVQDGDVYRVRSDKAIVDVKRARTAVPLGPTDADVLWHYDMLNRLSVWPHDAAASSILVHWDLLFVCTGNGTDSTHRNIPSPRAPTLAALNKKTGSLAAVDDARIGPRVLEGSWSSPTLAKGGQRTLVILGGPDGVCYAFDASPVKPAREGEPGRLQKVWWYDCNPPAARFRDRAAVNFPSRLGPSEIVATPVFYKGRVYVAIGQDPRHGAAPGLLVCIDASGTGDVTDKARIWQYDKISRTLSTVSIADGLLYVADVAGRIHCLDADSGRPLWVFDTASLVSSSTLVADGKVYLGTEKGELWVLAAGRETRLLQKVSLGSPIHTTPVAANRVLYVATNRHLFAFCQQDAPGEKTPGASGGPAG